MTTTLWSLADSYRAIGDALVETGGEFTPELEDTLRLIEGAFDHKAESCVLLARELQATADAADAELARLKALVASRANAAKRLLDYVKVQMETVGVAKVETPVVKIAVQRASRPRISFVGELPEAFTRVIPEQRVLDSDKALAAYKEQGALPEGFTVEYSTFLRVR